MNMRIGFKSKRGKIFATVLSVAIIMSVPLAAIAGFFPVDRPTFTCITPTNCPGADHIAFNSFTNNPVVGDERPFFAGSLNGANVQDRIKVQDGQTIVLRAYVHNNADPNKIGQAAAIARNVKMKVLIPTAKQKDHNLVSFISADNARINTINDTMSLYGDQDFTLQYVPGSASFMRKPDGANMVTTKLNDTITAGGTSLGDMNGCFEYSGYVTLQVKVKMDLPPPPPPPVIKCEALDVEKLNRTSYRFTGHGSAQNATITGYIFSVNGTPVQDSASNVYNFTREQPGTYTVGLIVKTDKGNTAPTPACIKQVTVDELPPEVKIKCEALDVQKLSRTSYKFTGHGSAQNATITGYIFSVDGTPAQDSASNIFTLNKEQPGTYTVSLVIKTDKGNTAPTPVCTKQVVVEELPPEVKIKCEALDVQKLSRTSFKFTGHGSVENAVITGYIFSVNGAVVQDSASNVYDFVKDQPGTYRVSLVVKTNKGNTPPTPSCTKQVVVDELPCVDNPETPVNECNPQPPCTPPNPACTPPPPPPPTTPAPPAAPTVLPDTGAGEIAGLFAAVLAAGTFAHYFVYARLTRFFS